MDDTSFNNCLLWAIRDAIKNNKYVVIRNTHHDFSCPGPHLHFLTVPKWVIDKYAESFVPIIDDLGKWPCPLFKGHVVKGDD